MCFWREGEAVVLDCGGWRADVSDLSPSWSVFVTVLLQVSDKHGGKTEQKKRALIINADAESEFEIKNIYKKA